MISSTQVEIAGDAEGEERRSGPVVVFKWSATEGWPVEFVSANVEDVFGYPAARFLGGGLVYSDIIHPEDLGRVVKECDAYLESGATHSVHIQYRVIRADGRVIHVDEANRVVRDAEGRPTHYVGHVVDVTERHRAEAELRRRKATLAEALEIAQLGYWEWDLETEYVSWSNEMFAMLGVEPSAIEPSLEAFCEFVHPDDLDFVMQVSRAAVAHHTPYNAIHRIYRGDTGELRYLRGRGRVFSRDAEGKPARIVGTVQDITESVRAEEVLRNERSWLHSLIQVMPDAVSFRDGDGKWLLANDFALEFLGLKGLDYQGKTTGELAELSDNFDAVREHAEKTDQIAWKNGEPTSFEQRVPSRQGEMRTFDITKVPVYEADGSRKGLLEVARDITVRKQTEEALKESKARLAEAQRIAHLGGWELDVEERMVSWSDEVYRIFGHEPRSEPVSYDFVVEHIPDADRQRLRRVVERAVQAGEPFQLEHHIVRADGATRIVHSQARVDSDEQGRPKRMVGIIQDITDRKKVEQLKEEFVSIVSHELRTPLTPITGVLALLAGGGGGELSPRAQQMVDLALRNSHRLLYLIDDLLDIQKMSSGQMDFHLRELELAEVVRESLRVNVGLEHQNNIKFALTDRSEGATVRADKGRLIQVMTNLLSNAAKFSPPNCVVDVVVEPTEHHTVRVAVRDEGPGIPEEFRPRVFEKFAQADSSSTRKHGGTGLGLTISRSIIERLDGEIGFETELGEGTTFYFELPSGGSEVAEK